MAKYTVIYTGLYQDDVITAYDWYDKINKELSERFINELKESEEIILAIPTANARLLNSSFRRFILPKFPYKVIYRIRENSIIVVALVHTARSNKFIKRRLKK
jgi:toxin ParE1/3/4